MAENSGLTAADIGAVVGNKNYGYDYGGDGFGNNGWWILIILFAIMGCGINGNGNNGNNLATTDFVSSQFTQRDISQLGTDVNNGFQNTNNAVNYGLQNTNNALSAGFQNTANRLCDVKENVLNNKYELGSQILTNRYELGNQIQANRYETQLGQGQVQRDILTQTNELNTNLLTTALQNQAQLDRCCCDIKELIRSDGAETRALITSNTIQDLRDRLTAANDVISDQRTASEVINAVRPYPVPAYLTGSPYVGYFNGYLNNGFYGNTVV